MNWLRLQRLKFKFRSCHPDLRSDEVDPRTQLGFDCRIERNAVIVQDVQIGNHSFVGENTFCGSVSIGQYCSIGRNCTIGGYEHPLNRISTSPNLYRNVLKNADYSDIPRKTIIKDDVWVGNSVCIKGGVTVGIGAVIGMGAIVTHDVPDYAIVVGNPAHIIKYRFNEDKRKELLNSQWWDMDENQLKDFISCQGSILF